jgi:hypothetical protein
MMHRIFDARRRGTDAPPRTRPRRWGLIVSLTALACVLLARGATQAASCPGRKLLTCAEKQQAFADDTQWDHSFVLDLELFEVAGPPLHLSNPSLAQFWRFETSAAAARSAAEFELQYEIADPNFEAIAAVPRIAAPKLGAHGFIDRRTAARLSWLMAAEQSEVLNLQALVTSINRATEASYLRGRGDWVAWQSAAAAMFASRAAGAIDRVVRNQRAVARIRCASACCSASAPRIYGWPSAPCTDTA